MSLYQCENCGCCENTALASQGHRPPSDWFDWTGIEHLKDKRVCSACGPTKYKDGAVTKDGKWHGQFDRVFLPKGMFFTNGKGDLEHKGTGSVDFRKYAITTPIAEKVEFSGKPYDGWSAGDWFKAKTIDDMEAFYWSRLPAIREAAMAVGYAIGVHGSCRRDFDLMAMQWRDGAADKDVLAEAIQKAACGISSTQYRWEQKPLGRTSTSMCICWTDHANPDFKDMVSVGHIDLSVISYSAPFATKTTELPTWPEDQL